jgi:hypothetical protein
VSPPVVMVWACELSVEQYLAAGRELEVPRSDCPDCAVPMTYRSWYRRGLRVGWTDHRLWVRRLACSKCRTSHAVLPSFCLVRRYDLVGVIGQVLASMAASGLGVRRIVVDLVPRSTARDWWARFTQRARTLSAGFAAAAIELGDDDFVPPPGAPAMAVLSALRAAWAALLARVGLRAPPLWAFASLVTGGRLISTATDPPWFVLGSRRLIPPAP